MTSEQSPLGRMVRHSTIYAAGNMTRQLAGFLMLPIYTRYLTPADYGVVGLLTFALAIMEPFFGARLGAAMPKYYFQEESRKKRNAVISTALSITGAVSAATALILFLLRDSASSLLFGTTDYAMIVGLFGFQILTQAVEYYGMTFIRIQQRPKLFITISLSKLALQLALNITLVVWLKMEVMGVVVSGVVSSSLCALGLSIYMVIRTGTRFDLSLAVSMLRFSWPLWFVGLTSLYIYSGNRYYIRIFSSLDDIGLYELAIKFAMILSLLIWMPFNQFWETERFNYYRQGNARSIFSGTYQMIMIILVGATLCIGIGAEPVIRIMAGPDFHDAHFAVPILTLAMTLSCITSFITFSFLATDNTRAVSYIGYLTAGVITVLNVALIPRYGYVGAAVALAGALLFQFLITYRWGRKFYDMGINVRLTMLLLGMSAAVFAINTFIFSSSSIWMDFLMKGALLLTSLVLLAGILWKTKNTRAQMEVLIGRLKSRLPGSA